MRYWVANCDQCHTAVGSTVGPSIFVRICGWSTSHFRELKSQIIVKKVKKHAALLTYGSRIGVLHGAVQYVNQDDGQIEETESISAGLDYPGVFLLHCFLKKT